MNHIFETIEKYHMIEAGEKMIAGVSGGADSVCLLYVLKEYQKKVPFELTAVHVEHGIRGMESLEDAAFTEELCARMDVPCYRISVDVQELAKKQGLSVEEAGRRERYRIFEEIRQKEKADRIAVAHNRNDQAETLLLRLARGCSTAGAAGIPVRRGPYIRPFLTVERAETEDYCRTCGQSWVEDATNAGDGYARNRVRHTALPALETVNPRAVQALARFSARMAAVDGYLTAQADTLLQQAACAGGWQAAPLADAHPAVRDQALAAVLGADAQDALVARLAGLLAAGQGSVNLPRRGRAVLQKGVLQLEQAP